MQSQEIRGPNRRFDLRMDFERNRQRNRLESFVLYEPVAGLESLAGVEWNRNSIRAALFRRGSSTSNVSKGSGENEAFEAIEPIPQVLKCAVFSSVRRFEGRWQSVSHQKKKKNKKKRERRLAVPELENRPDAVGSAAARAVWRRSPPAVRWPC